MKRLNTDNKIAPIVSQFVPLKMDTSSAEYRNWTKDHKKEGNSIPILYVVRADGKTLYAKSGSLLGDELPTMLFAALNHCGTILPIKQAQLAEETYQNFSSQRKSGNTAGAIKALSKIKKLGTPGSIESFAAPIVKINQEVQTMVTDLREHLATTLETLQSDDSDKRVEALLDWYQIKREHSTLRLAKVDLASFNRELSKLKELKPLVAEVKIIDAARISKSKSARLRGIEKLADLIEASGNEAVKAKALEEFERIKELTSDVK